MELMIKSLYSVNLWFYDLVHSDIQLNTLALFSVKMCLLNLLPPNSIKLNSNVVIYNEFS